MCKNLEAHRNVSCKELREGVPGTNLVRGFGRRGVSLASLLRGVGGGSLLQGIGGALTSLLH